MGFARRVVRKSVRKATPRSVRKVMHPVRTAKNAATPRSVKQLRRGIYTVRNPLGAAENALIGSVLNAGSGRRRSSGPGGRSSAASLPGALPGGVFVGTGVRARAGDTRREREDLGEAGDRRLARTDRFDVLGSMVRGPEQHLGQGEQPGCRAGPGRRPPPSCPRLACAG